MSTRRFGGAGTGYPLPISGPIHWRHEGQDLVARFELPSLTLGSLIVPSFSATGHGYDWSATWHFRNGDKRWRLDTIPAPAGNPAPDPIAASGSDPSYVDTDIDCFITKLNIEVSFLELRLHARQAPEDALIVIATGAFSRDAIHAGERCAPPCPVEPLSQMEAAPSIRRRICSPTCLAMIMGLDAERAKRFVEACYCPVRKLYGIWPRNIRAANACGFTGAIETFHSLDEAAALLDRGVPIIASIRYGEGELTGAATPSTGGHLVVLRGLTSSAAIVNDPAAASRDLVAREYDRAEFARAWLGRRGVGYVLANPSSHEPSAKRA